MKIFRYLMVVVVCATAGQAGSQVGSRGSLERHSGEEPGYDNGYSRIGGFVPLCQDDECRRLFFGDLQLTLSDEPLTTGSVGAGGRVYLESLDSFLGLNAYWDRRDYASVLGQHEFDQVGLGAELLGPAWAVRSNLYFNAGGPVSRRTTLIDSPTYQGNKLILRSFGDLVDEGMQGGDLEIARTFEAISAEA
ncbi:MAG: inverse autotransporter beta domain-containing protein, partial [Planctomycetales bacterium]